MNDLSGNIAAFIPCQKTDSIGDILRGPKLPGGYLGDHGFALFIRYSICHGRFV